jgi:iron complex outermembrane recepter protein
MKRLVNRIIMVSAMTLCTGIGVAVAEQGEESMALDISAQPLARALTQLAVEADLSLVYYSEVDSGLLAPALVGRYTAAEALSRLLAKTRLRASFVDAHTVVIRSDKSEDRTTAMPDLHRPDGVALLANNPGPTRLAMASDTTDIPSTSSADNDSQSDKGSGDAKKNELEQVVVTGTLIAGSAPVGASVTIYTRQDIEQSGAATLDQFARTITNNFSGADAIANQQNTNTGFGALDQGAGANQFGGSSFNLHGLGPNSTLTLLNGHRLAAGGTDGSVTDISLIPLSAIDRIEVLDDGASAIYGSDAVAGVVNIITRTNFDGAESRISYGRATDGGDSNITASQAFGKAWNGGNAFLSYEYNDQGGLDASQRDYIGAQGGPFSLMPESHRNSFYVSANQSLNDGTTISASGLYSRRDFLFDYNVINPDVTDISPQSGHATQSGGTISLDRALFGDWKMNATGDYSKIDETVWLSELYGVAGSAPNLFTQLSNTDATNTAVDLLLSGSLFSLGNQKVKGALGGSFRHEQFDGSYLYGPPPSCAPTCLVDVSNQRHVTSAYAEVIVPLIGGTTAQPWTHSLQLSAAGRYDKYSDFGSTSNYKVGLAWEPQEGFKFRGTYGTSFQAPLLQKLGEPTQSFAEVQGGSPSTGEAGYTDVVTVEGGNPKLQPETAQVTTAGFDIKPSSIPRLSLSSTYFHTLFTNRIQTPPFLYGTSIFSQPALAPFITLNPALSLVESYFNSPGFRDYAGEGPAAVKAIWYYQFENLASIDESGFDVAAHYQQLTEYGDFTFSASGTRLMHERLTTAPSIPALELVNTFGEPTAWKARGGLGWRVGAVTSSLTVNYVNSYSNNLTVPSQSITSWITADLYLAYSFGTASPSASTRNMSVGLSIINLTDERPPFTQIPASRIFVPGANPLPFDPTNASPVGRFVSLQVTKNW